MRARALVCSAFGLLVSAPALALDPGAPEQCATGPIEKTYGGTPWLVVSCSDGKSLVFVAKEGSKAAPFEFDLTYTGDGYDLAGHGKGDRKYTDAAYADLQNISAKDVLALIRETQGKTKK
ncbi:MAG TPA: hypothetical protein VG843_10950 [Rhizomicrobium sp.]|jgi:hypothetical protein|nr:hypothetical protein [Rhizomicrobium sp.]